MCVSNEGLTYYYKHISENLILSSNSQVLCFEKKALIYMKISVFFPSIVVWDNLAE